MPDTDAYDPTAGNEQLAQARQKTEALAQQQKEQQESASLGSKAKGGTIHKTGPYTLHAGEEVLPKARASEYRKVFKARGQAGEHKWGK